MARESGSFLGRSKTRQAITLSMIGQLLLLICTARVAWAADVKTPEGREAARKRLLSVRGEVVDEKNQPIAGARVLVLGTPTYDFESDVRKRLNRVLKETKTDGRGAFEVPRFEIPREFVTTDPPGWKHSNDCRVLILAPGRGLDWRQVWDDAVLGKVVASAAPPIEGRLLNHRGEPMAGLDVVVAMVSRIGSDGWTTDLCDLVNLKVAPTARTDPNGRFSIPQIPSDRFVSLAIRGRAFQGFYFYVNTSLQPKPLKDIDSGHPRLFSGKFSVTLPEPKGLSGKVTLADTGLAAAHTRIQLFNGLETETNASGEYQFEPLYEPSPVSTVVAPRGLPYLDYSVHSGGCEIKTRQDIKLERGVRLTGEVVDERTQKGVPHVGIQVARLLDSSDELTSENWAQSVCETDERGRFSMLVAAGMGRIGVRRAPLPYLVMRTPLAFAYIGKGVVQEATEARNRYTSTYSAKPGIGTDIGQIKIGRGINLNGRVLTPDGKPVPGTLIIGFEDSDSQPPSPAGDRLSSEENEADFSRMEQATTSDVDGRYVLKVCDVQKIQVYAAHTGRKLKSIQTVALPGKGPERTITQDVIVQPTAKLRMKVVKGGQPATEFNVEVSTADSETLPMFDRGRGVRGIPRPVATWHKVNPDGTVIISNVSLPKAGESDLVTINLGEVTRRLMFSSLKPDEVHDLGTVDMEPRLDLEVKLVDRGGKPHPGLKLSWSLQDRDDVFGGSPSPSNESISNQRGIVPLYDLPNAGIVIHTSLTQKDESEPEYEIDAEEDIKVDRSRKSLVLRVRKTVEKVKKDRKQFGPSAREKAWSTAAPIEKRIPDVVNKLGMKLRPIPAGSFVMGSPDTEQGRDEGEKQHRIEIGHALLLGKFEVTQAEFKKVMGWNSSAFSDKGLNKDDVKGLNTDQFPVESVTWFDAAEFCNRLSALEGLSPCYQLTKQVRQQGQSMVSAEVKLLDGEGYRLPTEAEWEYACRAGSTTPWSFGTRTISEEWNVEGNFRRERVVPWEQREAPTPVGRYLANNFGVYDMHGNVGEWCQDFFDEKYYEVSPAKDPAGPESGSSKSVRGGCFCSSVRSAERDSWERGMGTSTIGFRVVRRSPDQAQK